MSRPPAPDDADENIPAQQPLLTISTFARAAELSSSALRFYDREEILVPAEVDPTTGYRYYTPDQQRRAVLLRRLRDADVPLTLVRELLDAPAETADALLREQALRARDHSARVQLVLAELRAGWTGSSERDDAGARTPVEVRVDGAELGSALRQASRAALRRPDPSGLGCVLVEVGRTGRDAGAFDRDAADPGGPALAVAATDRYWMLRSFLAVHGTVEAGLAEPARGTIDLAHVDAYADWAETQPEVTVRIAPRDGMLVGAGDVTLPLDVAAQRFPALRQIYADVPRPVSRLLIDRGALAELSTEGGSARTMLTGGPDASAVSGEGTVRGRGSGASLSLPFTTALLLRVVAALVGDVVVVELAAADRPVLFRTAEQPGVTALLMPRAEP